MWNTHTTPNHHSWTVNQATHRTCTPPCARDSLLFACGVWREKIQFGLSHEELMHRIGKGELTKILNDNRRASLRENFDLIVRSECVSQHYFWYSAVDSGEAFKHHITVGLVAGSGLFVMCSSWAQASFSCLCKTLIQGTATLLYIATDWAPGVTYGMERYTGQNSLFIRVC